MKALILFTMIFLHIVGEFYLQGMLAKMKKKRWWYRHEPEDGGRYNHIAALIIHGYSWSFIVHLPFTGLIVLCDMFDCMAVLSLSLLSHAVLHALLANDRINHDFLDFADEQACHVAQVFIVWVTAVFALFG